MCRERITVIGAGNGGMTAAYHLTKLGREVCIYDSLEFDAQIRAIREQGGIRALGEDHGDRLLLGGFERIAKAVTDMEEAVSFADTLVMVCPSFAQELLFEKMLPYLRDNQTLVVMPGNFAGLVLHQMLEKSSRKGLNLTFVDAISIPWATRLSGPAQLDIMGLKRFLPVSIFPGSHNTPRQRARTEAAIPIPVEYLKTPLEAGLENINFGGHPLMTAVNIGLLENFNGEFNYYVDCCSPSTARAAAKMDLERMQVGKAYGYRLRTELEAMNALYGCQCETVYEFNRSSVTHGKVKNAPKSAGERYISEDVPYLLVPVYELAKNAGLRPVLIESVIHLACAYNDTDYFATGRTLEKMGLDGKTPEEIQAYFQQGI